MDELNPDDPKNKKQSKVDLDSDQDCTCPNCQAVFRLKTGEIVKAGKSFDNKLPTAIVAEPTEDNSNKGNWWLDDFKSGNKK